MEKNPSKSPMRILLAEDNHVNCKLASRMLVKLGYESDAVTNGKDAIAALRERPYEIVLMDLQMPEMDGLAATRWILANPTEFPSIPSIIALTANTLPEDRQRCQDSGMVDFIAKPVGMATLSDVLQRWMKGEK